MAEKTGFIGGVVEKFKTVFWALLIAGVFRTLFFQPFWIPSGSMKDTLLIGDFLFVSGGRDTVSYRIEDINDSRTGRLSWRELDLDRSRFLLRRPRILAESVSLQLLEEARLEGKLALISLDE